MDCSTTESPTGTITKANGHQRSPENQTPKEKKDMYMFYKGKGQQNDQEHTTRLAGVPCAPGLMPQDVPILGLSLRDFDGFFCFFFSGLNYASVGFCLLFLAENVAHFARIRDFCGECMNLDTDVRKSHAQWDVPTQSSQTGRRCFLFLGP